MWYSLTSRYSQQIKMYKTLAQAIDNMEGPVLIVHTEDRREILRTGVSPVLHRFLEWAVFDAGRKLVNTSSAIELSRHLALHALSRITRTCMVDNTYTVPVAHLANALRTRYPVQACRDAIAGDNRLRMKLAYFLLNHATGAMKTR